MNNSPTSQELQDILSESELFSSLDRHFAMFIAGLAQMHSPQTALAAALVSRSTGEGNICLDLTEFAGKPLHQNSRETGRNAFVCPNLPEWEEQLMQSQVVSRDQGETPLVLDGKGRLYLRRYWQYENIIIRFIQQRSNTVIAGLDYPRLSKDLKKLFQPLPAGETDWQKIAAIAAVTRSFCVISGGPGTGKTTTVAKILALLSSQHDDTRQLRILLGAPTGKAASRLQQAIAATGPMQNGSAPLQATTLHRMLGYIQNSPYFRHNADNPLAADIIVIDEASMVDLPLMAKLMQAVPAATRLILLGDRHQLASVQPGSVLGDICSTETMSCFSSKFCQMTSELTGNASAPAFASKTKSSFPPLYDSFVELTQSFRFSPESGISRLSAAVKEGNEDDALDILCSTGDGSIAWSETPGSAGLGKKLSGVLPLVSMLQNLQPDSCFKQLDSFRILCAMRRGPFGMERVNSLLEQELAQQVHSDTGSQTNGQYEGMQTHLPYRPVMVTRNDYNLQLFNGDVGIILPDRESQQSVRAFFRGEAGQLRSISPALLPGHETVFAMTVHKSQGSEFDRILLILPEQNSPLLTRELLYTAITRARAKVEIWGRKEVFAAGIKRQIKRTSGLREALWGGDV